MITRFATAVRSLRGNRAAMVLGTVWVLLIPTTFTVIPGWTRWSGWYRAFVLLLWFLAAAVVAVATDIQNRQVDELVGQAAEDRRVDREAAGKLAIRTIIQTSSLVGRGYDVRLFLPNEDESHLTAVFEPREETGPSEGWDSGQGATGFAFANNQRVVAKGAVVWDGSYGLTAEQQDRYSNLDIVASMPIRNARDEPIGVVTVSSEDDDGFLDTPDGEDAHIELASVIARMLIDVLEWAHD